MSEYQIVAKKTNELSEQEWVEFTVAFNAVFKKDFNPVHFKEKYFGSSLGYSVHGLLIFENSIVGMFSAIPRNYILNKKEVNIALGCDAFILKAHRKDEFFLKRMADVVTEIMKENGVFHFISIPNKTAYPYWKYYGGWKDIGNLSYYILPLKISKLIGKYQFLDFLSSFTFKSLINFCTVVPVLSKKQTPKSIFLKRDQEYEKQRYSLEYCIRKVLNKFSFVYKLYKEDNILTAYLIDCFPLSPANIALALKQIIKETKGKIDVILFVGKIDNPPFFFFKVPLKKEPRKQPFIGLSFDDSFDIDFFLINSWDVSLANFDNR